MDWPWILRADNAKDLVLKDWDVDNMGVEGMDVDEAMASLQLFATWGNHFFRFVLCDYSTENVSEWQSL